MPVHQERKTMGVFICKVLPLAVSRPKVSCLLLTRGPGVGWHIGWYTAVAPQNDIVEGIRQGVYDAVVAANGNGKSGSGSVVLNVNGREFMRANLQ